MLWFGCSTVISPIVTFVFLTEILDLFGSRIMPADHNRRILGRNLCCASAVSFSRQTVEFNRYGVLRPPLLTPSMLGGREVLGVPRYQTQGTGYRVPGMGYEDTGIPRYRDTGVA
ncbi:hypothetical protein LWI28_007761 [Acer negundo]|uniref:Uncharacterized protein n=1 Tax=Acer negundo TaxID=4023 RepID=A0AAD5ICR9_ACENE|nr:hypothetical protein LWI28_007761 [Acer negundo]